MEIECCVPAGVVLAVSIHTDLHTSSLQFTNAIERLQLLGVFPRVYSGRHITHPAVTVLRTRGLTIEHSPVGPTPPVAFADGERIGPLPLRVEVRPGAVRLLA